MTERTTFESDCSFGDAVFVDGDQSIRAVITAFMFACGRRMLEVSWFNNGDLKSAWIDELRLSRPPQLNTTLGIS